MAQPRDETGSDEHGQALEVLSGQAVPEVGEPDRSDGTDQANAPNGNQQSECRLEARLAVKQYTEGGYGKPHRDPDRELPFREPGWHDSDRARRSETAITERTRGLVRGIAPEGEGNDLSSSRNRGGFSTSSRRDDESHENRDAWPELNAASDDEDRAKGTE